MHAHSVWPAFGRLGWFAVADMFFDYPYSLDDNDQQCVEAFGIHSQYNWAAYK